MGALEFFSAAHTFGTHLFGYSGTTLVLPLSWYGSCGTVLVILF